MKLGLYLLGDGMRLAEIGQLPAEVEAAGFKSVWTSECWHSGFQAVAAATRATTSARPSTRTSRKLP